MKTENYYDFLRVLRVSNFTKNLFNTTYYSTSKKTRNWNFNLYSILYSVQNFYASSRKIAHMPDGFASFLFTLHCGDIVVSMFARRVCVALSLEIFSVYLLLMVYLYKMNREIEIHVCTFTFRYRNFTFIKLKQKTVLPILACSRTVLLDTVRIIIFPIFTSVTPDPLPYYQEFQGKIVCNFVQIMYSFFTINPHDCTDPYRMTLKTNRGLVTPPPHIPGRFGIYGYLFFDIYTILIKN